MSDNSMYDILGKMASLNPTPVETAQPKQKIYESVDARGSILSGVSKVEKRLTDKFISERDESTNSHKGIGQQMADDGITYSPEKENEIIDLMAQYMQKAGMSPKAIRYYLSHDEDYIADQLGCLPRKDVAEVAPPGAKAERMVKGIKKSLGKDGHVSNKDKAIAYATTWQAHNKGVVESKLTEGINFSEMVKETDTHVSEMLSEIQKDIQTFKATGQCSDRLEAFLKVHHHGKKQLQDAVRPEDIPAVQRKQAGQDFPVTMGQVNDVSDKISHADTLRQARSPAAQKPTMDAELNELAQLAGVQMDECMMTAEGADCPQHGLMECPGHSMAMEGNALTGKLAHTHKGEEFEVGGKTYTNNSSLADKTVDEEVADEGNAFTDKLKDTSKGEEFELDGKKYKDTSSLEESMMAMPGDEDKLSVTTNMNSDGEKDVSVNAKGSKALDLLHMLKLAGVNNSGHECEACGQSPCECNDEGHEEPQIIAIGAEEPVGEAEGEYANVPHEEYQPTANIINQGDDLNRKKSQHAWAAAKGDNPMAEEFDPIETLGRKLMREYNSIKIPK